MNAIKCKDEFIKKNPQYINCHIEVFKFGDDCDYLANLVKDGIKTATSSLLKLYEIENSRIPEIGDIGIILDSLDNVVCVIQNIKVSINSFLMIDDYIAKCEGEGDTLDFWRKTHESFFKKEVVNYGVDFSFTDEVVVEFFKLID